MGEGMWRYGETGGFGVQNEWLLKGWGIHNYLGSGGVVVLFHNLQMILFRNLSYCLPKMSGYIVLFVTNPRSAIRGFNSIGS
jgi:hypothetical protein